MKNSDVFGYTLLIFGLGVVTGLLVAPRRGEETRKILIENIEEYRDKACRSVRGKTAEIKKNAEKFEESLKKDLEEV
ncbi:MAG: YtxH domain-containing protein [Actinomycetota bacterium]|jgi:gas vesicle protein|nr:YtxH domain-containing protein [Actinomycetota bacterium]